VEGLERAPLEVLGEREPFLANIQPDTHPETAPGLFDVKHDGSKRMSSSHCRMFRMGVLTSSARTGTWTILMALLLLSGRSPRNPSYRENRPLSRRRPSRPPYPILVYHDPGDALLPEMPPEETRRRRLTAYHQIPQAIAAICAICNPHRAAEATPTEFAAALVANEAVASKRRALSAVAGSTTKIAGHDRNGTVCSDSSGEGTKQGSG
jgi:hypothetical protein